MAPSREYLLRLDQPDHFAAHGQNRETHEDRDNEHERSEKMHRRVGAERNNVFLGQRLDAIGNRLKETEWADAIRAKTVLDAAKALALEHCGQREEAGKYANDGDNTEQHARSGP